MIVGGGSNYLKMRESRFRHKGKPSFDTGVGRRGKQGQDPSHIIDLRRSSANDCHNTFVLNRTYCLFELLAHSSNSNSCSI